MTDARIIAVAITVLAVFAGTIFNNVRISDTGSALNKRIDDTKEVLRAEMKAIEARMENRFNSIDRKLDEILRMVGGPTSAARDLFS
jgi:hypothetical protein